MSVYETCSGPNAGTIVGMTVHDDEDRFPEKSDILPNVRACLSASGDFDPVVLDDLFGVKARSHKAGDRISGGRRIAQTSLWHYSTPEERTVDLPAHIDSVLSVVRPHVTRFNELRRKLGFDVEFHIVAWIVEQAPIGTVDTSALAEMAAIGASLNIDLYTETAEDISHESESPSG